MGELPWEYLERRALEIANYLQTTDEQEWEIIFSKSLVQVSHLSLNDDSLGKYLHCIRSIVTDRYLFQF